MSDKLPAGSGSITPLRRPSIHLPLGRLLSTPGAIEATAKAGQDPLELLSRHRTGDWGEVDTGDSAANDQAVIHGARILSVYTLKDGVRLWIITEADRSATTLLLPDEY
jgi:hypothetical protein